MTVFDLLYLFVDESQTIWLYDMNSESYVYKGSIDDIPCKYKDIEIFSINCLSHYKHNPLIDEQGYVVLVINIELGGE